jgi:hypothetical protein
MAKVFTLVDDLDGTPATQTVQFDAFGRRYSIDLSDKNAAELNAVLTKYASAGTEIVSPNRIAAKAIRTPSELNEIRNWARSQGHTVSDKGRIPEHIIRQFEAAQAKAKQVETAPETNEETTEEAPEGEGTGSEVGDAGEPTQAEEASGNVKPVPAAEFSAEMGKVLSLDAGTRNTKPKAKAGTK